MTAVFASICWLLETVLRESGKVLSLSRVCPSFKANVNKPGDVAVMLNFSAYSVSLISTCKSSEPLSTSISSSLSSAPVSES